MSYEQRLQDLGITLPETPTPVANYVPGVITGNLLFLSGQGPRKPDGTFELGLVGADVDTETAYAHARLTGLFLLSAARSLRGTLDRVEQVVKLLAMVRATPDYPDQPKVANGLSDLMVEVFGDAGRHARSAVGMGSLPNGMTFEAEAILQIRP
jgi:enamine deaminase RidA (YjgF/YER057c/UK114 family)